MIFSAIRIDAIEDPDFEIAASSDMAACKSCLTALKDLTPDRRLKVWGLSIGNSLLRPMGWLRERLNRLTPSK